MIFAKGLSRNCLNGVCWRGAAASKFFSSSGEVWKWVPPAHSNKKQLDKSSTPSYSLPLEEGKLLVAEDVRDYLESQGADNAVVVNINGDLDTFKKFVIASGRSQRHIRKMSESVVAALKERKLWRVRGSKGVEGDKDDDWQCVDCHSFIVHIMLPDTRRMIDLESHWSAPERPYVPHCASEAAYEAEFSKLLDQYPCPDEYITSKDVVGSADTIIKEL